jgi:hypothetical protein
MSSYNFNTHTLNGQIVPYCALPFHAIDQALKHPNLTQAAKNAYMALMAYAAYKNKLCFNITATWIAEKLACTRKTAASALNQLREFGFANDMGILIPEHDKFCTSKKVLHKQNNFAQTKPDDDNQKDNQPLQTNRSTYLDECCINKTLSAPQEQDITIQANAQHSFQATSSNTETENNVTEFCTNKKVLHKQNNFAQTKSDSEINNAEQQSAISFENQYQMFKSLGFSDAKAKEKADTAVRVSMEKSTQPVSNFYPHNNTPNQTTPKNNIPDNDTVSQPYCMITTDKHSGKLFFSGRVGDVGKEQSSNSFTNLINSTISKVVNGIAKTKRIINPKLYCEKALRRMGVSSPIEIERYTNEVIYSVKAKQMQSINACLWLIESGKWRTPAGLY